MVEIIGRLVLKRPAQHRLEPAEAAERSHLQPT
jgi:hypothetical protein